MLLKLHFLVRARLWSEVVVSGGDRVFVPTTEACSPGQQVSLQIEAPELEAPLQLSATVKELRPLTPSSPAGVLVTLDAPSLERCRDAMGMHDESARVAGRAEPRADCELPARLLSPAVQAGCVVKSLSAHGLTLKSALALPADLTVGLAFQLPDGSEVLANAQVMWTRTELKLAGLKLLQLEAAAAQRVAEAVGDLLARKSTGPAAGFLVLVADDDPSILDFTSRVVAKAGHRVVRAERGDVALELVRKERPALVFLDVLMPGLDGLEVCRAIRADVALSKTPVLLVSAMGEDRLVTAARDAGADGYLTKPMRLDALRAVLAERLR